MEKLNKLISDENFWKNNKQAKNITKEASTVEKVINSLNNLEKELEDLKELIELSKNENSELEQVKIQLNQFEKKVEELEEESLFNGEYEGHFFARWHTSDLSFTYLGKGKNYRFEDGHPTFRRNGTETTTVKVFLSCENSREILSNESEQNDLSSTFALEKHLEDFLVQNWNQTQLSQKYDLLFEDDKFIGQQYATDTGFIDLLAISKDKNELLVIELKKGRASDSVLGQIQRYMGYILEEIAEEGQTVRGLIIALEDDIKLRRALVVTTNIEFFRYKVSFELFQN